MKKRTLIRVISYALAVCLSGFGFFYAEKQMSKKLRLEIENNEIKNLNALEESMNNITETLNKAVYLKGGSDLQKLSLKLFTEGEIAKDALSNLPSGKNGSETLNKFLSQVGNYSVSLSRTASENNEISDQDSDKLEQLYETSKKINKVISETNKSYDNLDDFSKIIGEKIDKKVNVKTLATSLDGLEEDLVDYPTLIYDGPFSDHILKKEPIMIKDAKAYNKSYCKQRAENIFDIKNPLKFEKNQNGKIECYRFSNGDVTVSVSKQGGYIVYMRNSRDVDFAKITNDTAVAKAKEFMAKIGLNNMSETYYYSDEGVCVINFAYKDGETLCYTDLIKVGIALDTGEVMLFESSGYLSNHKERNFEKITKTVDEAKRKLSKKLNVISSKICLIPTDSAGEQRCFEFLCENKEKQQILVYIDTENLETADILLIEKSAAGTVVK